MTRQSQREQPSTSTLPDLYLPAVNPTSTLWTSLPRAIARTVRRLRSLRQ